MLITNLKWADNTNTALLVTSSTGKVYFVPWPTDTWYAVYIQEAVAGGMVIQTADPPLPSIDFSNLDNIDKIIKAIGLTIAEVSGRTPAQIKTIFKQKYDTL